MRRITFCADDYGISPSVSESILQLAETRKIHGISCMVTEEFWPEAVPKLKGLDQSLIGASRVDVGLHLNMSEGVGLTPYFKKGFLGIGKLLIATHLRTLPKKEVKAEALAQLENFRRNFGRNPDYIDGHQYCHHLPIISEVVREIINDYDIGWVRCVYPMKKNLDIKSNIILYSGAKAFRKQVMSAGIQTNTFFSGIYSLEPETNYRELMQQWLRDLLDGSLVVCHPSIKSNGKKVDHYKTRLNEFHYFASEAFDQDCTSAQVCLMAQSTIHKKL